MSWSLDKTGARFDVVLHATEQMKFDNFQNAVNWGSHPKDAATGFDYDFKCLYDDVYQIRLSQKNRATFRVDEKRKVCVILQVGGHT
ncbi:MAG TPA: hypothetical protein PLL64_02585 [Rhodothermales bacterium]|nr:hypothetical protein [Bacteroidota bacterium]HRK73135.1 hypothetical protein [Rhodothermales bacterium]HRR09612.1 hypothetical protein [Rhodothermales bacterium]